MGREGLETVLWAIGEEVVNGFAKPIDVLAVQEQTSSATTTQAIVAVLNDIYGPGIYARATLDGARTSGSLRPGLIYNTTTIELIEQVAFGTASTAAQARQTLRYRLRPMGYGPSADFFVYCNHYKAGTTGSDLNRRDIEAHALRMDLDGLGEGTHAILAGDYNIQRSSEASYQTLLSPGSGQAFDPINQPGNWNNNEAFRAVHTQAPATDPPSGLVGGGMDDRFDFQLITGEFLDGEGMDYLNGSYRAFGNNGTHAFNGDISTGTGATPTVLSALMVASDHLPVVADYQLPAVLSVFTAAIPATLDLGQEFQLAVTVSNAADVLAPLGADELDYQLISSGDIFGMFTGLDAALGAGHTHLLELNTTTPGPKSGLITVSSNSQGVAGGVVEIAVTFNVLGLAGDYNRNGTVDAADYLVWRTALGQAGDALAADGNNDGLVNEGDYDVWKAGFGNVANGSPLASIPEPTTEASFALLAAILSLARKSGYAPVEMANRLRFSLVPNFLSFVSSLRNDMNDVRFGPDKLGQTGGRHGSLHSYLAWLANGDGNHVAPLALRLQLGNRPEINSLSRRRLPDRCLARWLNLRRVRCHSLGKQ